MMENSKLKIGITSTAIALTCAGITYAFLRYKYRLRDAVEAFSNLSIKTITTEKACDEVVQELRKRSFAHRAVGFDCEWVTEHGKRQPVALVQLSTADGLCGLFRLSHLKTVPQSLKDLLEDESIYKVGVAPCDDGKYLHQDYSVEIKSTLDIRHLAGLCGHNPCGLAGMSKALLKVVLDKSWRIRCSNWSAESLTDRQVSYAAADAHVAIKMFVQLVYEYHGPSTSWFKGSNVDVWQNIDELCQQYADVRFKSKQNANSKNDATEKDKNGKLKEIVCKRYPHATRSKPLYHNCFMQAPDGEMLCTCDTRKALWYVEKELADIISEEPLTVRLRFEPAGRAVGDVGEYYRLTKDNRCVVCGKDDSYIRKNVVPREYRKYFPEIMKEHSSHDVVLLCVPCHQASNVRDQAVRERLANMCDAPLAYDADHSKFIEDAACKKIRRAARTLLYQVRKHDIPADRLQSLEAVILEHYTQHDRLTEDLLREAADLQVLYENTEYESHGQKVVEYFLLQAGGLLALEQLWREHFLRAMRPRFMPALWSVSHNQERLRVRLKEGRLSEEDLKLIGVSSRWL